MPVLKGPIRETQTLNPDKKCFLAAKAALGKKAKNIEIFHVAPLTTIADYFIICSAESERQVKAIMEGIDSFLAESGESPFSVEGEKTLGWLIMDYSDVIVHIFKEEVRDFYQLERLWGDAPKLQIQDMECKFKKQQPLKGRKKRSQLQ